jgi:hypothetical protein
VKHFNLRHFSLLTTVALLICSGAAYAQSSGNFTYGTNGVNATACTLNNGGSISGGKQCQSSCTIDALGNSTCTPQSGECAGNAVAGIKTSSGSGNVFAVTVSAVIGLLTDVTVSSNQKGSGTGAVSSSALAGAAFTVTANGPNGAAATIPNYGVTFDSRYIQISTNLFQALSTQCLAITGGCFITFNESTVSAHSFQWLIPNLTSGQYTVTTSWADTTAGSGISNSLVCVGPVIETVQQNKVFHFNTVNVL